jgi:hypothetical protein
MQKEARQMMMVGVDPSAFRFALGEIKDGNIFEQFGLDFLSKVLGYDFVPAGGVRDRGIDGMEDTFNRRGYDRAIYQLSIEKDPKSKIRDTLDKLKSNKIHYTQFVYVTNITVPQKDLLIDYFTQQYKKAMIIYDENWLASHVNDSEATIRVFQIFIDSYLHKFNRPGESYVLANLEGDPRLYVFLRQQWEEHRADLELDEVLVDTLILFALEDTDPEKGILLTRGEILDRIRQCVKFDVRMLHSLIDDRLKTLSKKPRRINHHMKEDAFCLRFEERVAIQNRNLNDAALYETFRSDTETRVAKYFQRESISESVRLGLIEEALHTLFCEQGLEFADFILHRSGLEAFDKSLPDIVSRIVDKSAKPISNKQAAKTGMLVAIRDMVYNGTRSQKTFLNRLSHTYMMLFLLQCDPKLATYFGSLASKLRLYVCTSIIIPALTEQFLEQQNRRYTNLLLGARQTGVQLLINEAILRELGAHFKMIRNIYRDYYEGNEDLYTDEVEILYIDEIMIRAYFYARMRGQVKTFDDFIGTFVSPSMFNLDENLVEWLKSEFGIEYVTNASHGLTLKEAEIHQVQDELVKQKYRTLGVKAKARVDAETILTIYALRERDNELGTGSIWGYRTWWLSSDVITQRAAKVVFGDKYENGCYMRPDFLYNYISLAPSKSEIDSAFRELFPTLLGVNLSFHLPGDVTELIHGFVKDHKQKNPARVKAILRELADDLKQNPSRQTRERVRLFLDDRLRDLITTTAND